MECTERPRNTVKCLQEQTRQIGQEQDHKASGEIEVGTSISENVLGQQTCLDNIQDFEIPERLKAPQYDYALFFCQKDRESALQFQRDLHDVAVKNSFELTGCTYDDPEKFPWIQTEWQCPEEAIKRSTYMLFYMTANCEEEETDKIFETHVNEALMKSLKDESKRWCFIPVFTKPKDEFHCIPYGLASLRGLTPGDMYYSKQVKALFTSDTCRSRKMMREREQDTKKQEWLEKQKKKRLHEKSDNGMEEEDKRNVGVSNAASALAGTKITSQQPTIVYNINIQNSSNIHVGDQNIQTIGQFSAEQQEGYDSLDHSEESTCAEVEEHSTVDIAVDGGSTQGTTGTQLVGKTQTAEQVTNGIKSEDKTSSLLDDVTCLIL